MLSTEVTDDAPEPVDPQPLLLDDEERELVRLEVEAIVPALTGERRERYEALAEAARGGTVPADLQPLLESVLSLALQTARARTRYRAEGERILTGLYRRTAGGRELDAHLRSVNAALRSLVGHELTSARVGMRTLGHFTISLQTDAARITLAVRPDGVDVDSVAVGEGGAST